MRQLHSISTRKPGIQQKPNNHFDVKFVNELFQGEKFKKLIGKLLEQKDNCDKVKNYCATLSKLLDHTLRVSNNYITNAVFLDSVYGEKLSEYAKQIVDISQDIHVFSELRKGLTPAIDDIIKMLFHEEYTSAHFHAINKFERLKLLSEKLPYYINECNFQDNNCKNVELNSSLNQKK